MKIVILMEDTCGNPLCECEHGLSVYVETKKHKILMDTGAGEKTLMNAKQLGVDLTQVDTVVLSHGHYDHSGGMLAFGGINRDAVIYMQQTALGDYYHGERYIGVDKRIAQLPNVRMLNGDFRIDEEISVFTGIAGRRFWPESNLSLSVQTEGRRVQDEFCHEQCLVVQEERNLLLSGCAHNGILNILDRYKEIYGDGLDAVISGFHMMKKTDYSERETDIICRTAGELKKEKAVFYTGHCTGQKAVELMQPVLGERMVPIHCGMEWML
jgi:Metal-dependent hydrolases of the beta-lactamase superfamily II